ncbi:MAG: hypothetical protein PWP48_730 [Clostridiales bacterium]|nr:hypothetical protein [Clostridiales bacterium]
MSIEQKQQLSQQQLAVLTTEMEKRKKSIGLAYFLWLILGTLGIHKFYIGQKTWGIVYLILGILGWPTVLILAIQGHGLVWMSIGLVFVAVLGILLLIDVFTISKQVREANEREEAAIVNRLLKQQS